MATECGTCLADYQSNTSSVPSTEVSWGIHHPYWSSFGSPVKPVHISIGVAMTIIGIIAVCGNVFVLYVFLRFRSLRTAGNVLVMNLAVSDLLMALTGFPLYATASFYGSWIYPDQVCHFYGFCGATFGLLSINLLASIAVDRYLVITNCYTASQRTSWQQAVVMVTISWTNSLVWSIPPLFGWNRYILEGLGTTCSFDYLTRSTADKSLVMLMFVCGFCVPLLVICVCYGYIYGVVHRHERMFRRMSTRMRTRVILGGKEAKQRTELKTARTVLLAVLLYCMSWLPYATIALYGLFSVHPALTPLVTALPGVFAKMSTIYNPFLYTFSHPRFRKKVKFLLFNIISKQASKGEMTLKTAPKTTNEFCHTLPFISVSEKLLTPSGSPDRFPAQNDQNCRDPTYSESRFLLHHKMDCPGETVV